MKVKAAAITMNESMIAYRLTSTVMLTIVFYLLLCSVAYAVCLNNGNDSPMGDVLCAVVGFMYGNLGRGLATLGIIVLGVGALLGKTSWGMAITVGVGISVIFNAETITSLMLCGNTSAILCT